MHLPARCAVATPPPKPAPARCPDAHQAASTRVHPTVQFEESSPACGAAGPAHAYTCHFVVVATTPMACMSSHRPHTCRLIMHWIVLAAALSCRAVALPVPFQT